VEHFYESIEGWFDFEELYREAVRRMPPVATMVEVGVYRGRSVFFLAVEAENAKKGIEVYAVDRYQWPENSLRDIDALRKRYGLSDRLRLFVGDSVTASRAFKDDSVDFVFLDAGHDYADVKADIAAWWPKLKSGGIMAGHDYDEKNFPGVVQAVNERFIYSYGYSSRIIAPSSANPSVPSWWVDKL
jgi:predicted O-methyltransferase YrrM